MWHRTATILHVIFMKFFKFLSLIAISAMITTGCKHAEHDHDHDHEGHECHLAITAYSNDIEFFAQASPMIAGKEGELVCHFTYLNDFKPVTEGKVSISLTSGGKTVNVTTTEQEEPGIYHIHITPAAKGKAKLTVSITNDKINSTVSSDEIEVFDSEEDAHEFVEEHEPKSANCANFPKEMSWAVDFATAPAELMPIGNVIRTVGQVLPSQGDEVTAVAKVSGIVTLSGNSLTEGSVIAAGKALCSIDASATVDNNLSAQQAQAQAEYARAKKEYDRLKSLREDKLAMESEVSAAKAALETAEANLKAMKKGYGNGTQTVTAPRGGYLKQLLVSNGQYVSAGEAIAVITQSRTLQLKAEVPASHYSDLAKVTGANIGKVNGEINPNVKCRLLSYGRQTSVASPLIPVIFEMDNVSDFVTGSFVNMFITTRSADKRLCVRSTAILEEMGNYFVFVQVNPELFEKRQVKIGATDGVNTEIKDGIKEGERIVTRGAVLIKLQQSTGSVDPHSGHQH